MAKATCAICGRTFRVTSLGHIYCSRECRQKRKTRARSGEKSSLRRQAQASGKPGGRRCRKCGKDLPAHHYMHCANCLAHLDDAGMPQ